MDKEKQDTGLVLRDIDIPFGRMVAILLKIMLAALPAIVLFYTIVFALALLFFVAFGGGLAALGALGK